MKDKSVKTPDKVARNKSGYDQAHNENVRLRHYWMVRKNGIDDVIMETNSIPKNDDKTLSYRIIVLTSLRKTMLTFIAAFFEVILKIAVVLVLLYLVSFFSEALYRFIAMGIIIVIPFVAMLTLCSSFFSNVLWNYERKTYNRFHNLFWGRYEKKNEPYYKGSFVVTIPYSSHIYLPYITKDEIYELLVKSVESKHLKENIQELEEIIAYRNGASGECSRSKEILTILQKDQTEIQSSYNKFLIDLLIKAETRYRTQNGMFAADTDENL